jgi:hypothetical protein
VEHYLDYQKSRHASRRVTPDVARRQVKSAFQPDGPTASVRSGSRVAISARLRVRRSASKHAEAYLLIDGYLIAYGCESIRERLRHVCSPPVADGLEAVRPVVERVPDDKRSPVCLREETGGDGLGDALIDGANRLKPLVHIERSELVAVGGDAGMRPDRLRVNEQAAGDEGGVDVAQGVHDALQRDASQRPAAEPDVEALAREVERLGVVDGEADPLALLARQCTRDAATFSVLGSNA